MDLPRNDGFGVIIVTVAIVGAADIVLVDEGDLTEEHQSEDGRLSKTVVMNPTTADTSISTTKDDSTKETSEINSAGVKAWRFSLNPGDVYVLSGYSRNKCAHGVIRSADDQVHDYDRQSLNFRFGIHSAEQAYQEIDRHWQE